jgi:putative heme-binding domain-containing protein
VIGASYQARIVVTVDGRQLTGLLVEDSQQRIVLKTQGGKQEIIARDQIEEMQVSQLSLMPEGVEKQYPRAELMDLLAFLALDRPPSDSEAKYIPGTPAAKR